MQRTMRTLKYFALFCWVALAPCVATAQSVRTGAERMSLYLPLLQGKRVGLVAHQASMVYHCDLDTLPPTHTLDLLLGHGVQVVRLFSPEHGFRGNSEAGEQVGDSVDAQTGLCIVSLDGNNKKPTQQQLDSIDVMVFDLQDMGVRFFTYLSTLHYVMEACAQKGVPLVVFDRYNPHTSYVDGPMLDSSQRSFVGMHPVPVVYGMTIGEYALMINGQHWLDQGLSCQLVIIPLQGFAHEMSLTPSVSPSPNLSTRRAMLLYPSLCFFEGTNVSVGRGTPWPFEVVGAPAYKRHRGIARRGHHDFSFTPQPTALAASPLFKGKQCHGLDLRHYPARPKLDLSFLIQLYEGMPRDAFFLKNGFFDRLAGTTALRTQLQQGASEDDMRDSWKPGIEKFMAVRGKYLLYP
ncbi:MAG: DUF1343 domain-containing protein [Bacteroidales bacterium]|nr:DUF1343 domain-containing protein [Bacteroidales bacterium]